MGQFYYKGQEASHLSEAICGRGSRVEAVYPPLRLFEQRGIQGERMPIKPLLLLLYHKDESIRLAAIKVLETQSERVPLEPLVELLGDEDKDVRDVVLRILKKVAPDVLSDLVPQAIAVLQGKVVGDAFTSLTQMYVAETIGGLGIISTKSFEKLVEPLDYPSWQVRMKAIQALGQLRRNIPDAALRRLLELRRDPDPKMRAVREAADDALAEILSLETGIEDE